jgi:hypothetical protein
MHYLHELQAGVIAGMLVAPPGSAGIWALAVWNARGDKKTPLSFAGWGEVRSGGDISCFWSSAAARP